MPFSDIPGFKPYHMLSGKLRQLLLKNGIQDKCAICGLSKWLNKDIVLHTDHIDGNLLDNTFGNLRLICPNCHSQTDTYSGRNAKINRRPEITDSDVRDACAWIEERGGTPSASTCERQIHVLIKSSQKITQGGDEVPCLRDVRSQRMEWSTYSA